MHHTKEMYAGFFFYQKYVKRKYLYIRRTMIIRLYHIGEYAIVVAFQLF